MGIDRIVGNNRSRVRVAGWRIKGSRGKRRERKNQERARGSENLGLATKNTGGDARGKQWEHEKQRARAKRSLRMIGLRPEWVCLSESSNG